MKISISLITQETDPRISNFIGWINMSYVSTWKHKLQREQEEREEFNRLKAKFGDLP